jgi:hypothetical protein
MEATPMIRELIHSSIISIFDYEDTTHPQYPTAYYLDLLNVKIRWITKIDSWVPPEVYEGVWVPIFEASPEADVQSIVDDLVAIEDVLIDHCLQFQAE